MKKYRKDLNSQERLSELCHKKTKTCGFRGRVLPQTQIGFIVFGLWGIHGYGHMHGRTIEGRRSACQYAHWSYERASYKPFMVVGTCMEGPSKAGALHVSVSIGPDRRALSDPKWSSCGASLVLEKACMVMGTCMEGPSKADALHVSVPIGPEKGLGPIQEYHLVGQAWSWKRPSQNTKLLKT